LMVVAARAGNGLELAEVRAVDRQHTTTLGTTRRGCHRGGSGGTRRGAIIVVVIAAADEWHRRQPEAAGHCAGEETPAAYSSRSWSKPVISSALHFVPPGPGVHSPLKTGSRFS